jgi:choline dehydrogenase-like flavoprotein
MAPGRIHSGTEVSGDASLSCDVCVVGSGASGAVLAYELCAKGLSVVMLEEGGHHARQEFDMSEERAYRNLYQELGNRTTTDRSISILQGRCVGGGTTVNWCSTFRTPPKILKHWHDAHGVQGLSEEALLPHFETIERRLSVAEWPLELINRNNRILWEGLGKLGYQRGLIRRNVFRCANLGYCGLGCPIDAKQSALVTFIPDAVDRGLSLYTSARAVSVEHEGRRATGVRAEMLHPVTQRPTGATLRVSAKVVALSCGALNSPALLLRSGLLGGGRVGRRTFLHPVVVMLAEFEEPVEPFSGAPQSVYSHHFLERGPGKMGFFLEVPPIHPLLAATTVQGFGRAHREWMERLPFLQACIALGVDGLLPEEEGGTVRLDSSRGDRLDFEYPLEALHWEAFREACKQMARIQFAAGAKRVASLHSEPRVLLSEADLPKLDAAPWEKLGVRVMTAHQMGGCAMGADARVSVLDSQLRYRGLDNLFVVDGSALPTGLGVNPQLTLFGLARWGAAHVASAVHPNTQ